MDPDGSVAVVIVTHNSASVIAECLDTLDRALTAVESNAGHRVIVADNASTDATLQLIRSHPRVDDVIELGGNFGYAAGINAGMASVSDGAPVLVLNPDVRLAPESIAELRRELRTSGTGIAFPKVLDRGGGIEPSMRRESSVSRALGEALLGGYRAGRFAALGEMVTRPQAYEARAEPTWASGCALLIAPECARSVGPWDESFFHGAEEADFCLRARDQGWSVAYVPGAEVVHLGGSSEVSPVLRSIMVANRLELHRRRNGHLRTAMFRGVLVLNEALRAHRGRHHRAALRTLLTGRRPQIGDSRPGIESPKPTATP